MEKVKFKQTDDLPLVLNPMDVAAILGTSKNTTYELFHSYGFPAFRLGKKYYISAGEFLKWLDGQASKKNEERFIR